MSTKIEDIQPIQILKGHLGKLVVKPCRFENHVNVNVGVQSLGQDGRYFYSKGGFNLWSSAARELAEALLEMADVADDITQGDDLQEGSEDD
jgi:hypothetical protein